VSLRLFQAVRSFLRSFVPSFLRSFYLVQESVLFRQNTLTTVERESKSFFLFDYNEYTEMQNGHTSSPLLGLPRRATARVGIVHQPYRCKQAQQQYFIYIDLTILEIILCSLVFMGMNDLWSASFTLHEPWASDSRGHPQTAQFIRLHHFSPLNLKEALPFWDQWKYTVTRHECNVFSLSFAKTCCLIYTSMPRKWVCKAYPHMCDHTYCVTT
jgi:hypothetical protein